MVEEELNGVTEQTPATVETPAAESVSIAPTSDPAQPAQAPQPAAQPQPEARERENWVPVALLDEREKRRAAEARAAQLEQWRADQERQQREAAAQAPNPLDDPEGFSAWVQGLVTNTRKQTLHEVQGQTFADRAALSREMMEDQLGDKFGDLAKFIDSAPDAMHAAARKQAHPYRWFHRQFQQAEQARRAQALVERVGDKSIEDIVAEAVAAERAKWDAGQGGEVPAAATESRTRNADGTFASPSQPKPHQPPSLAVVHGAPAPRGGETRSGYDAAFRRG